MTPRFFYSLFMLLALAVFLWTRHFLPHQAGLRALPLSKRLLLALASFIGGALGAKLPFVLGADGGVFSDAAWFRDGKTITTGLIGAYLGVELAKTVMRIRVKTGDSFALPLALAMAVGRWGCFFNGCCYGMPTNLPWGVDFGDHVARHPTQAYESLFHLAMAGVLWLVLRRGLLRFQHLKLYLIAYGLYRFAIEFIRPEPSYWLDLTFYQWISVALVVGLTAQWAYDARHYRDQSAACPPIPLPAVEG
jgi:phosphatidylglycerol:prolipoprotein diacylglycerol transferase